MKLRGNALAVLIIGVIVAIGLYALTRHLLAAIVVLAVTAIAAVVFARLQTRYDDAREQLRQKRILDDLEDDGR